MDNAEKRQIMDFEDMKRAVSRIATEIIEKNRGTENVALIGIQRRGVVLADMLAEKINQMENIEIETGILDITLYRDDLSLLNEHPVINGTYIDFVIENKVIVLVDDVLYTGRTVRAAVDAIMDMGRPSAIQLAVLIDRGNRELPVSADYVGKYVPTSKSEEIIVNVEKFDGFYEVNVTR